jgi:hypothetical protein
MAGPLHEAPPPYFESTESPTSPRQNPNKRQSTYIVRNSTPSTPSEPA